MTAADKSSLLATRVGINTYKEAVVYMRQDCHICLSEGFESLSRIRVSSGDKSIIATLNIVSGDLIHPGEVGLSECAWDLLGAKPGDRVVFSHPEPLNSLSYVRSKIYGNILAQKEIDEIISDITSRNYSGVHIATFLTACAGGRMNVDEVVSLTQSMMKAGDILTWPSETVVDKHCVGGLPGNRTTPIVVSIVTAAGLIMPKTSSRAITSPAGTADTMEVLAPVNLDLASMKQVVEQENGCIVWGGAVALSPADDILIRVERAINLDTEGQMVASVLSKKLAAGSTDILIDMPVGPTAKVRTSKMANTLGSLLKEVGEVLGLNIEVSISDGTQPIGRGIGPALEARDILEVLQNQKNSPHDLCERALAIAAKILEFSPNTPKGEGIVQATEILESGKAWEKFQSICEAQGGLRDIPEAQYTHQVTAINTGVVKAIDNRRIAQVAKLAGAPHDKVAGIYFHSPIGKRVEKGEPLFTIHAESKGQIDYALHYVKASPTIIEVGEE